MSTILLQYADAEQQPLLDLSEDWHADYCKRHRIAHYMLRKMDTEGRHVYWGKIAAIRKVLDERRRIDDILIWMDADCLIVRPWMSLSGMLRWGDIGMVDHCDLKEAGWHLNAGLIAVRNTEWSRDFFTWVWEHPVIHPWHDQLVINERLKMLHYEKTEILLPQWNSCKTNPCDEPVVKAWHGGGSTEDRLFAMKEELEKVREGC